MVSSIINTEPGSNGNEEILNIFQISRTRASPSDILVLYPGPTLGVSPLCRDAVCIFWAVNYILLQKERILNYYLVWELFWPLEFRIYIFHPMRMTDTILPG